MRTDKIRKYLILNIPYLFILWAFLKLGTAYRLAAGNDFAHKLIGLGQTIGPAFVLCSDRLHHFRGACRGSEHEYPCGYDFRHGGQGG